MGAFHAYDIRGIYNVDFDKETAYKVGYFLPQLLNANKVLVGRDCRLSGQEIHDYLIAGITDAGADVDDIGYSSTPLVYFGTANYGYKASVQITASHNPPEYNGMKV
ncbi:MAG: phosphomannomutase/phosphoglucomutase, partial [Bacteroidales bacterium]|nr:phosphomannomutase/phosphoglucomutase [Bacteroidales bacterium]